MYLSRVELNMDKRECRKAMSNPEYFHAGVENCFIFKDERVRHLWRIDTFYGKTYLLIVSEDRPDFTEFMNRYGHNMPEIKEYDGILAKLHVGTQWRFRIKANPTYTHRDNGKLHIYGHVTARQQMDWLLNKSENFGFVVNENHLAIVNRGTDVFLKQDGEKKRRVTIATATFEGVLTITDIDLFWNTLCNGMGRSKAYGCGMLTVAKL